MNIIKTTLHSNLKKNINNLLFENLSLFKENSKINYINIYHKDWLLEPNKNNYSLLINRLKSESHIIRDTFVNYDLHYFGFIQSQPNCDNQHFHIDYFGKSTTFFIPLIDLTNKNGTEYLYFYDKINYKKYFDILLNISNNYIEKEDIINYLESNNLSYKKDFEFKIANAKKYSIIEMPYYVFHRGKTNETEENRLMFQITFTIKNNNIDIINDKVINDAELDDKNKDVILKNRNKIIL